MLYKDRMSYYDIDQRTAQMYAPIDEYLKQTKRFSPKAMKRKYFLWIFAYCVFILIAVLFGVDCIMDGAFGGLIITGAVTVPMVYLLRRHILNYGKTPHPDMLTCENILDNDGVENVYADFCNATDFTKHCKIGRYYIFIKKQTLVRMSNVVRTELVSREHYTEDGIDFSYHFSIHVQDSLGHRVYDLEELSENYNKRMQRFAELSRAFEARQKGIDTVQI